MSQFCNYIQNGAYNAIDDRFTQGAFLARTSTGAVRKGVLAGVAGDGLVTADGALQVRVAPFTAVLGDTGRGAYVGGTDAALLIPVRTPETTNNRSDLLCWRPLEGLSVDSNGESTLGEVTLAGDTTPITKQVKPGEVYWVTGTPSVSTSPPLPAVPAGAVPLARVYVAGGASAITSANITDARVFTGLHGARVAWPGVNEATNVGAWPTGTEFFNPATETTYVREGASGLYRKRPPVTALAAAGLGTVTDVPNGSTTTFSTPITITLTSHRAIRITGGARLTWNGTLTGTATVFLVGFGATETLWRTTYRNVAGDGDEWIPLSFTLPMSPGTYNLELRGQAAFSGQTLRFHQRSFVVEDLGDAATLGL